MTEIQSLFKLQELDMECLALETALRELPVQKEIDESQERLSMLRERLSRLGLELNRVRKEQKHEEWEIKDITATAKMCIRDRIRVCPESVGQCAEDPHRQWFFP